MKLRQIWIPKEFRLPEPEFTKEQLDLLEELIQMIGPKITRVASATKDERAKMVDFLVDLGTGIWRVRRKIDGLSRMPREIRDALYSLESMWIAMSQDGVEIVDHIGTTPSDREAKIVEVREIPGLAREQVVDAIKPTIILRGEVVQIGEVVVGRPPYAAVRPVDARAVAPAAAVSEVPEQDDETPVSVHEVETITMAPPLRKWSPAEEKTPEEKGPDAPGASAAEDTSPYEMPESLPEVHDSDVKRSAETASVPTLDSETAAAAKIVEAEEEQNAAEETLIATGAAPQGEAQSADVEPPAKPAPKRTMRRKTAAETVADTIPDAAPENDGAPEEKTAERKVRASTVRKPRKKSLAPSEDTDVTPKEEA
jgi:hypothetical protein